MRRTAVDAATLGYVCDVTGLPWTSKVMAGSNYLERHGSRGYYLDAALGVDVTVYRFSDRLDDVYGSSPTSFHMFLRLRGARHFGAMGGDHDMHDMPMDHSGHDGH